MLLIVSQMGLKVLELLKRKMVLYLMSQNNKLNSSKIFLITPKRVDKKWISTYINAKLYLIYLKQMQDHHMEVAAVAAIEAEVVVADMVAEEAVAVAMEVEVEVVVIVAEAAVAAATEDETTTLIQNIIL
jgi:hypothetical protein